MAEVALKSNRREEILRLAAELMAERGYDAVSVRDLAQAASLSLPSLYWHIGSKEQLLLDLSLNVQISMLAVLEPIAASSAPADQRLRLYMQGFLQVMESMRPELSVTIRESRRVLSPEGVEQLLPGTQRIADCLRWILEAGRTEGLWREEASPSSAFVAIQGILNWSVEWFRPDGPKTAAELGGEFADLILGGLLDRNSSPAS